MKGTDRLHESRWGIFNHYLARNQNTPSSFTNQGRGETSWDECTRDFDVNLLAENLHALGAHYYFITIMQGNEFMLAPNSTFDRIAGTKPGEACSKRDLVLDIYDAITPYGIDLYLYYTGDGPYMNETIGKRFGFTEPREEGVSRPFVEKWASVLEEYSVRYGDKVKGWWIDGCYRDYFKYNDELLEILYKAAKKGNPDAIVALNNGVDSYYKKNYVNEDFVCGEFNDFYVIPRERYIDGAQAFSLIPLGVSPTDSEWDSWCALGVKRDSDYLTSFINCVNKAGGVVTIDIPVMRDGSFDREQFETLKNMKIK